MTQEDSDAYDALLRAVAASPPVQPSPGLAMGPTARNPDGAKSGDTIGGRFEIERLARSGGMGAVYRALDRVTGSPVALKLVTGTAKSIERFSQEVRVLSEMTHPAIVRYVAHGSTASGQPFLAMEWLEGEDLGQTLDRRGLGVSESMAVARRVAEGLAVAHARGVIHRDIKPSNVFLVGGEATRTKLIDFGIVRLQLSGLAPTARPLTRTGAILGTVGYMSPEQAIADRELDARTDVFALGCVLFECLTGRPAFSGGHLVAVLAKVLREQPPTLRELRPELPAKLEELLTRMLSKDREQRPDDAGAVLRELEALGDLTGGAPPAGPRAVAGVSAQERRLVSVLLALLPPGVDATVGDMTRLANGAWLATTGGHGASDEQVVAAAARALELRRAIPGARIAIATGRAVSTGDAPPGAVIDQAANLLAESASEGIRIDELTAGILGGRFEVRDDPGGRSLLGPQRDLEPPRTLLGKLAPCVGRERELALLDATLRECADDSVARAVLVTGPAGQGKSRLRHEFLARARISDRIRILCARADPIGAGSAFLLARQLVRDAAGIREGEADAERKLRGYVAKTCPGDHERIADFLGEIVGLTLAQPPSPQLRVARNDPQTMGEWMRRSFAEWFAAECAAHPVLLVLEDLHWGDRPTVVYIGEALRALAGKALMVVAFARPEATETFPNLWTASEALQLPLGRLSPRASERLVRSALGPTLADEVVTRLVERANGNPFYLEELIRREADGMVGGRSAADGGSDTLPETVLALVQSRLERLESEARRIVRAASIFGETFWDHGVAAVLGQATETADLGAWLETLTAREVLAAQADARFPGTRQYAFHHGILRDAAYEMLTDTDRAVGHRLAGEWLESVRESDPLAIAEHFERGDPPRAAHWLRLAAQLAYDGAHLEAAWALATRGLACSPDGTDRLHLLGIYGAARAVRGQWRESVDSLREAFALSPVGEAHWYAMGAGLMAAASFVDDPPLFVSTLQSILGVTTQPVPSGPYGMAIENVCTALRTVGQYDFALEVLARAEALAEATPDPDPAFVLWLFLARAHVAAGDFEPGRAFAYLAKAAPLLEHTGDVIGRTIVTMIRAQAFGHVGRWDLTETAVRDLSSAGPNVYLDMVKILHAGANLVAGRITETISVARSMLDPPMPITSIMARTLLALALSETSDVDAAETEAHALLNADGPVFAGHRFAALTALSRTALTRGRLEEALAYADQALEAAPVGHTTLTYLVCLRARTLHELGRGAEACADIESARNDVWRIASTIEDPEMRESFLTCPTINGIVLQLANEWLEPPASE